MNQTFSREGVRDDVFKEGCYEFLILVTLNSLGLISKLERREIFFNNHEVEFLLNKPNQISQPMCMNTQIYD